MIPDGASIISLRTVFLQNGFPNETIQKILFKEKPNTEKLAQEVEILNVETGDYEIQSKAKDFSLVFFAPFHPRANRMFKMLKNKFGIDTVYKKKGRKTRNVYLYSI